MPIEKQEVTQYYIYCEKCPEQEAIVDANYEGIETEEEALEWAGYHQLSDGTILCPECYESLKQSLFDAINRMKIALDMNEPLLLTDIELYNDYICDLEGFSK